MYKYLLLLARKSLVMQRQMYYNTAPRITGINSHINLDNVSASSQGGRGTVIPHCGHCSLCTTYLKWNTSFALRVNWLPPVKMSEAPSGSGSRRPASCFSPRHVFCRHFSECLWTPCWNSKHCSHVELCRQLISLTCLSKCLPMISMQIYKRFS